MVVVLNYGVVMEKSFRCELNPAFMLFSVKFVADKIVETFGPVYRRFIVTYALKFESEALDESTPDGIEDLEQLNNYLLSKIEKHPKSYCALIYGMSKADQLLQGGSGTARTASSIAIKRLLEDSGVLNQLINSTDDPYEALTKTEELFVSINTGLPGEVKFQKLVDGNVRVIVSDCPFLDACEKMRFEGLWRPDGTPECYLLTRSMVVAEIITHKRYDYRVEDLNPPESCKGYLFPI
ncbi:MAG: hypothetical protein KIH01_04085 [Candidatus Freyarchaeota archaeon]|nr:hypothetical protein [Candidatus Jordarchaeia archaeon]